LSYRNANVVIICYDVTRYTSYENVTIKWVPEIRHFCPGIPILLVACKTDLRQSASAENQNSINEAEMTQSFKHRTRIVKTTEVRGL